MKIMCLLHSWMQGGGVTKKDIKTAENRKKKSRKDSMASEPEEEPDTDSMDWWTKYHASMDTMMQVIHIVFLSNWKEAQ